jgi:RNA polymerase-binding transcription factor DksA
VAERAATVVELTGQGDVDSLLEREVADASAARASEAIEDIDDALARMDAGTYGLCESCGLHIPVERLEVIPHARFCVRCSSARRAGLLR